MVQREKTLLKKNEIVGGYDKSEYQTQRIWANAEDGVKVPISLVYKKELFKKTAAIRFWCMATGATESRWMPASVPFG